MASYKDIQGFNIQNLTADPDNAGAIGQIYYNSTTGSFKAVEAGGIPLGTWASGGSLNTARNSQTGAGTQTSALSISGGTPPVGRLSNVESYDGSSWTEVADVNLARNEAGGTGTQTAALFVGGASNNTPALDGFTELYNGTSWTEVNNMVVARDNFVQAFGTQTAAIIAGGYGGSNYETSTESWDGTSWTEVNNLNQARGLEAQTGTQTAGLVISGFQDLPVNARIANVESWNGTSWTEITDVNSARDRAVASGVQTDALFVGGRLAPHPPAGNTGATESWNGTSWTEQGDMATARWAGSGTPAGTNLASLFAGGFTTVSVSSTEEWTVPDVVIKTLTTS